MRSGRQRAYKQRLAQFPVFRVSRESAYQRNFKILAQPLDDYDPTLLLVKSQTSDKDMFGGFNRSPSVKPSRGGNYVQAVAPVIYVNPVKQRGWRRVSFKLRYQILSQLADCTPLKQGKVTKLFLQDKIILSGIGRIETSRDLGRQIL